MSSSLRDDLDRAGLEDLDVEVTLFGGGVRELPAGADPDQSVQ